MRDIRLTASQNAMVRRLQVKGLTSVEITRQMAPWVGTVKVGQRKLRAAALSGWTPAPGRLSAEEREDILVGLKAGESMSAIARRLGRAPSTVTREVAANGGPNSYGAWRGLCRARARARRPKSAKLCHAPLVAQVSTWLELCWSPQEIAKRLQIDFADDPMMQVSYETIYQSLFVQGRGELRRELARCLRSGRAKRRRRGSTERRIHIPEMVMISERPAEVADRAVPGNWEGDLIMGANNRSAIGTLVERSTRYVLLLHLPNGKRAEDVRLAMEAAIGTLPAKLVRSVTWDQGTEMAHHREFTMATGIAVYFCDPHSPWQRGSNENTNGLLRQFLPKGTDLSVHTRADLDEIERKMNGRPRKTLEYMKPSEKLADFLALTG